MFVKQSDKYERSCKRGPLLLQALEFQAMLQNDILYTRICISYYILYIYVCMYINYISIKI